MNPFTTNAALQVLGLPRLCEAQYEALGRTPSDEAFLQGLIDLAFQARMREEKRTRAMHAAYLDGRDWTSRDEVTWRQPLAEVPMPDGDAIRRTAIEEVRHARDTAMSKRWLQAALIGIVGKTPCTDQAIALEQDALSEPATYRPRALSAAA